MRTTSLRLALAAAAVLLVSACGGGTTEDEDRAVLEELLSSASATEMGGSVSSSGTTSISLFFGDEETIIVEDCSAVKEVRRTIPQTPAVADAALRLLFAGPLPEELAQGVLSTFGSAPWSAEQDIKPLGDYYRSITLQPDGTAVVDFTRAALTYLNGPACAQQAVKAPIIRTLKQFPAIRDVQFSIDGMIWTEWDA